MRLRGKDIAVYRESAEGAFRLIALSTACDVNVSADIKEISSILSGRAKRFRAGRYGWTMNIEALIADEVDDSFELLKSLKVGTRLRVSMSLGAPNGSLHAVAGYVLVATWSEGAPLAGMATYKVAFQGDGDLEIL